MIFVGLAKVQLGADAEAVTWFRRSVEANRKFPVRISISPPPWRGSVSSTKRGPRLVRGLRSIRVSPYAATDVLCISDNPTYRAGRERLIEGMRLAGVPEG